VALARCGDRTCVECRKKDFYRLLRSYRPYVATLQDHQLKLVTLTLKNTAYLEGTVDRLRKAWKKLLRRGPYRTLWHGGAYAIECVNKGRGWHVHLHALVEGGYIAQEQLVQDWLALRLVTPLSCTWKPVVRLREACGISSSICLRLPRLKRGEKNTTRSSRGND
jgi:hypothetical protein